VKIDPDKNPIYIIAFAAIVSGLFTAAIMALHVSTEDIVRTNQRLLTEKALVDLFALGDAESMTAEEVSTLVRSRVAGYSAPEDDLNDSRRAPIVLRDPVTDKEIRVLAAFREDLPAREPVDLSAREGMIGYAFEISGVGFWARIDGWLAVTPDVQRTLGIVFLQHSETPGLGGRITEPAFRDQFRPSDKRDGKGLLIIPPPEGKPYVSVSHQTPDAGSSAYERHVDAVTGATGTSTAVGRFLNEDLRAFRRAAIAKGLILDDAQGEGGS
jgi:Na+-transporting NADH:ubiquinone oxidoreductase subunit C